MLQGNYLEGGRNGHGISLKRLTKLTRNNQHSRYLPIEVKSVTATLTCSVSVVWFIHFSFVHLSTMELNILA
jgi:hypothetical protein